MAQQDTLLHVPEKMRRVVRDTNVTKTGLESRFECLTCHRSVWRPISTQNSLNYLCNGMTIAQIITGYVAPMSGEPQPPPSAEEITDLLRETLRYNLHPRFRLRIIAMIRRLRSPD